MGDRMADVNGGLGMVKYAAARFGSKYVVDRKEWKSMVGRQTRLFPCMSAILKRSDGYYN